MQELTFKLNKSSLTMIWDEATVTAYAVNTYALVPSLNTRTVLWPSNDENWTLS